MHFQVGNVVLSNDPLPRPPRSSRKTMVYEMIMTIVPLASGSEWCLSINGSFYPCTLFEVAMAYGFPPRELSPNLETSENDLTETSENDLTETSENDLTETSENDLTETSENDLTETSENDFTFSGTFSE
ncbi:hypothetical protein CEXT_260861 [Caerostris extrusa]|uniref:Uncharacterized protein n=1 Tax=Caerostris extrusa TaxID=172846 RepID=A0AAV4N9T3_CAEEX|nr:hypothetical protein CEXT_260861 [Caerostris extrusa]